MNDDNDILSMRVDDYRLRRNYIGASDAPAIMGVSPWTTPAQLYRQKVGLDIVEKTFMMQRGNELEEEARYIFCNEMQLSVYPVRVLHDKIHYMMASMDGLSFDRKIALEIKCPGKKDHEIAASGEIPEKYFPQLQHQMETLDIDEMFYMSYSKAAYYILKMNRDLQYCKTLVEKEARFYECLKNSIEPDGEEWTTIKTT